MHVTAECLDIPALFPQRSGLQFLTKTSFYWLSRNACRDSVLNTPQPLPYSLYFLINCAAVILHEIYGAVSHEPAIVSNVKSVFVTNDAGLCKMRPAVAFAGKEILVCKALSSGHGDAEQ